VTNGNVIINGNPADLYEPIDSHIDVVNNSNLTYSVKVKRIVGTQPAGSSNYFCWKICYGPSVTVSPDTLNLNAGSTISLFHGYYVPNGSTTVSTIKYVFFNFNNPNDSVYVNVTFDPTATSTATSNPYINLNFPLSVKELKSSDKNMLVYTDAKQQTLFVNTNTYKPSANASIVIYDVTGKVVADYPLDNGAGLSSFSLPQLSPGIYCCALHDKGTMQMTKKIFIR
jgi:hypothetical protein